MFRAVKIASKLINLSQNPKIEEFYANILWTFVQKIEIFMEIVGFFEDELMVVMLRKESCFSRILQLKIKILPELFFHFQTKFLFKNLIMS